MLRSIVKSLRLKRLSRTLEGRPGSALDMLEQGPQQEKALEALLDLCLADPDVAPVAKMHGADRETLKALFRALSANGAGQRVRGHYVVASVFAFGAALDYALSATGEGISIRRAAFELISYFEDGRTGGVVPGVGKLDLG